MVGVHYCSLNVRMTFDLWEIKEMMSQQAKKQLVAELKTLVVALVAYTVCIQQFGQSSPVQCSPVHSPIQSRVQGLQRPTRTDSHL